MEVAHQRHRADHDAGLVHRPYGVAEVALRLAQVVRLSERLARQRLVRYLRVGALGVGVVGERPLRGPLEERCSRSFRGGLELVVEHAVPLRVDDDRTVPRLDQPAGDPRLADRLARPRRTQHQRVRPRLIPDGDRDGQTLLVLADDEAVFVHPALALHPALVHPAASHA